MKENKLFIILIVAFVLLLAVVVFESIDFFDNNEPNKEYTTHQDITLLGTDILREVEEDYIITTYEDYKSITNSPIIKKEDFTNSNYLLLSIDYDPCSESNIKPYDYAVKNDIALIKVAYDAGCGVCPPQTTYFVLKVNKSITKLTTKYDYVIASQKHCNPNVDYKPIIYLYPEEEMDITVKLLNEDKLSVSYPKYENYWDVHAYPNGKLIDNKTNREQYGLYWEGNNHYSNITNEGFIVKGEDTIKFLEEKLEILGLNERESDEFIIYWLPKLEKNKYNYIRFETKEEIDNYMGIEVNPKPDTIIRVNMDYKGLNHMINIKEQELEKVTRKGYTLVEWGGSEI